jgi:hypothetical protein
MFEIKPYASTIILLLVLLIVVSIVHIYWAKKLNKQNLQLIKLYLELKFLHKNLIQSASIKNSKEVCAKLISSIREYYNLEEIIVIDLLKKEPELTVLKENIYNFVQENALHVKSRMKNKSFLTQYFKVKEREYMLYIFKLNVADTNCSSFITCVVDYGALLEKYELMGLESHVSLLRTRIIT